MQTAIEITSYEEFPGTYFNVARHLGDEAMLADAKNRLKELGVSGLTMWNIEQSVQRVQNYVNLGIENLPTNLILDLEGAKKTSYDSFADANREAGRNLGFMYGLQKDAALEIHQRMQERAGR